MNTTAAPLLGWLAALAAAGLALLIVNEIPLYQRNGGPILVRLGTGRAVHVGDVLIVVVVTAAVLVGLRRRSER